MLGEKGQWQRAAESNEESNLRNNEPKETQESEDAGLGNDSCSNNSTSLDSGSSFTIV